jgi:predicted nucleotidyltransferase
MRQYKFKWGRFLFFRWLPISWTLQAIHSLDKTEKVLRLCFELLLIFLSWLMIATFGQLNYKIGIISIVVIHTIFGLFDSSAYVGLRECFVFIRNSGIKGIIAYLNYVQRLLAKVDCAEAILVYGSLCRKRFHDKSDLDLRIIRRKGVIQTLNLFFICIWLRTIGVWFFNIPLDLKMIDNLHFLEKEMRYDEKPIVIFCRDSFEICNRGVEFKVLKENPKSFLRD